MNRHERRRLDKITRSGRKRPKWRQYEAHPGRPHQWFEVDGFDPLCTLCGRIEDADGNVVHRGAQ